MFRMISDAQELEFFNFRLLLENLALVIFQGPVTRELFLVGESCRYNKVAQVCRFNVQVCIDLVELTRPLSVSCSVHFFDVSALGLDLHSKC
jgi:hypothetical protein